jgi:uncharacterized protein
MAENPTRYPLRELILQPGQTHHEELSIALDPYKQAGFDYAVDGNEQPARLDVTRMQDGVSMRLRINAELKGPCSRCLEEAIVPIQVSVHEVHEPSAGDPEMTS